MGSVLFSTITLLFFTAGAKADLVEEAKMLSDCDGANSALAPHHSPLGQTSSDLPPVKLFKALDGLQIVGSKNQKKYVVKARILLSQSGKELGVEWEVRDEKGIFSGNGTLYSGGPNGEKVLELAKMYNNVDKRQGIGRSILRVISNEAPEGTKIQLTSTNTETDTMMEKIQEGLPADTKKEYQRLREAGNFAQAANYISNPLTSEVRRRLESAGQKAPLWPAIFEKSGWRFQSVRRDRWTFVKSSSEPFTFTFEKSTTASE